MSKKKFIINYGQKNRSARSARHTKNSRSNNNFSRIYQLSSIPEVLPIPQ